MNSTATGAETAAGAGTAVATDDTEPCWSRRRAVRWLLGCGAIGVAPAAFAQGVSRAQAAQIARSRAGGGTVLQVRTRGDKHVVRLVNPQGQVVTIVVDAR